MIAETITAEEVAEVLPYLNDEEKAELELLLVPGYAKTDEARALEAGGYEEWLKALGPRTFTRPLAPFHREFWGWYWGVRQKSLRGEQLTPKEMAMLVMWFRGAGKSTNVEWACIGEGALVGTGFVGYVADTEALAKGHLQSIRGYLDSPEIALHYPGLSSPRVDKHGNQTAWRQDYLATASGWGIIPIGLEEGVRGGRLFDLRFTMFVFDDIDNRKDSAAAVEKKLKIISHEILPAGTADTIKLFPQNLIHENSVLNQIYTRRSDVLSEREESGPYPAFDDLELELDAATTGRKWKIKRATPVWPSVDMRAADVYLADSGKAAFLSEYQHDFESFKEGRVLQNWDDSVHVIRRSDFARLFGTARVPDEWNKYAFNDWSNTKSAYHANVAGKIAVSNQNSRLPGRIFLYDLMSFPAHTEPEDAAIRFLKSLTPDTANDWDNVVQANLTRANLERYIHDTTRLIEARREVLANVIPQMVEPILDAQNFLNLRMSHEAKTQREIYKKVFGLPFEPMNPGEAGGVDWINHYLKVTESKPHPFLVDKMGEAWMYMIVDDTKYSYPQDASPDFLHDSDLARYQFKHWRQRAPKLSESGIMEYGPMKMNDDFGNGLQFIFVDNIVSAAPLTKQERTLAQLKGDLKPEVVMAQLGTETFVESYTAQQHALKQIEMREAAEEKELQKRMGRLFGRPAQHRRNRR